MPNKEVIMLKYMRFESGNHNQILVNNQTNKNVEFVTIKITNSLL